MTEFKVYSDMLEELFNDYSGKYEHLLKKIPVYFKMLQKIYACEDLDWELKFKINACFSYFAVPVDIIPDDLGPEGYLDDLFVCVYVLNNFIPKHKHLIEEYGNPEIVNASLIKETFQELTDILGDKTIEILNFIGLSKFDEMAKDLAFLEIPKNPNEKLRRIQLENLELMALLQTIIKQTQQEGNKIYEYDKLKKIRELFNEEEWTDVEMLLEKIKIYEEKFRDSKIIMRDNLAQKTQEELNEIRRNVSLEIDKLLLEEDDN